MITILTFHQLTKYLLLVFSHSVVSYFVRPQRLQHARLPCPSLSLRVCSDSCPLSQRCYPTVSFSVAPFSGPQSFLASVSFPMSWFFTSKYIFLLIQSYLILSETFCNSQCRRFFTSFARFIPKYFIFWWATVHGVAKELDMTQ